MTVDTETGEIVEVPRVPFAAWLQDLRRGAAHAEVTSALAELVEAVLDTGKAGTLTFTLKVKPAGHGVQVIVEDETKLKAPQGDLPVSLFFVDGHNNLLREDPRQLAFGELREVPPAADKPLKEAK